VGAIPAEAVCQRSLRSQLGDETDIHDSCEAPSSKILWRRQGCSLRLRYRSLRL
jgi:hypothetical protein